MSYSIFFKHRGRELEELLPITFLLIEVVNDMQEEMEGMTVLEAVQLATTRAGIADNLTEQQVAYILDRMKPPEPSASAVPAADATGKKSKRGFGTEFLAAFDKLTVAEKCLYASDYDFEKARLLYCVYDKEVSEEIIKHKVEMEYHRMQAGFEAVVFGMGGSFGKGSGGGNSANMGDITDHAAAEVGQPGYAESAMNFMKFQNSGRRK